MATQEPLVRLECDHCGNDEFAVYYDPTAQGTHVECTMCACVMVGAGR
jgi:hypothetical protein